MTIHGHHIDLELHSAFAADHHMQGLSLHDRIGIDLYLIQAFDGWLDRRKQLISCGKPVDIRIGITGILTIVGTQAPIIGLVLDQVATDPGVALRVELEDGIVEVGIDGILHHVVSRFRHGLPDKRICL